MVQLVDLDSMAGPPYLCVFHLATAGLQGASLGSDEEEIVLLIYIVIDKTLNKVIGVQQYTVKPNVALTSDTYLSSDLLLETQLTHELLSQSLPLEYVIKQFDGYVRSLQIDPFNMKLVCDGELPFRQCLQPECCSKKIDLPDYYNSFIDLRKDFKAFYSSPEDLNSVAEMIEYINMTPETESEFYLKEAKDMLNITQRLIADGYRFNNIEIINLQLEPGLCSKDEEVDANCVVRARGLPWQSSDGDIAKFFRGLNIAKGGVALCLSAQGRRNGEALVRFVNSAHRDMALKRHKHHMGQRYIEVYKSTGEEFVSVAGGSSTEAHTFLSRGGQVIVRMRGLPYECTATQVLEFFRSGEAPCEVLHGEDGVLFVKKADGRATGDAFVLFAHETDAPKALGKHRELIGSRYIELFRSTTAEVQQVLNRSQDPQGRAKVHVPLVSQLPSTPLLPQHVITCGIRKDCIRLRGLPYEASVEHILDFLGDYAKNIVFQGVHMVYNSHGQPSGEAFIQMDSETSAFNAANHRHHQFMVFGKKQRYVEVFQCSGDDMNSILTGGQVSPKATSVLASGIEPGTSLPVSSVASVGSVPSMYYDAQPMSVLPPPTLALPPLAAHPNVYLLNQLALQQQQSALAASLMHKSVQKPVYTMPPPGFSGWSPELDPYSAAAAGLNNSMGTMNAMGGMNNVANLNTMKHSPVATQAPSTAATASSSKTTDSLALVPVKQPDPTKSAEVMSSPAELYPASYPAFFLPPRLAMYPKPTYPLPQPFLVPQMGVLGMKRTWEQAFPMDGAAIQAAKRWQTPQAMPHMAQMAQMAQVAQIPGFASPSFYHEV